MQVRTATTNPDFPLTEQEADNILARMAQYLPLNYGATKVSASNSAEYGVMFNIVITGTDNAGWTLDGYVIPRLASGNMFVQEVN